MATRALVLLGTAGVGVLFVAVYSLVRSRAGSGPERLDVGDFGLELMPGCCAFVVFTSPACRPCKAALSVVTGAAAETDGPTEVTTLDASERSDVALRYGVRTIPTVFLITASGHVIERWRNVPDRAEVEAALNSV
jgi:hypothetical protein